MPHFDLLPARIHLQLIAANDRGFVKLRAVCTEDGVVRIIVHGHVPELRPLYAYMRVSVAPLRWGAGVKGKVNTAHQLGVPIVCTSIAVDGMHSMHGKHVLVGDNAEQLAGAVLELYYNATVWRRLVTHGTRLLETRFSASRATVGLLMVLSHLRNANTLMGLKSLALTSARPRFPRLNIAHALFLPGCHQRTLARAQLRWWAGCLAIVCAAAHTAIFAPQLVRLVGAVNAVR